MQAKNTIRREASSPIKLKRVTARGTFASSRLTHTPVIAIWKTFATVVDARLRNRLSVFV
ncbi:MAG: hypothetical protein HZB51_28105 [Chloroflexi bacterium]|nr:hypothetical protein [Chloroflexota bacterium]